MKLSVIINTFNEGPRVSATCEAFLAAGADEIVVCSDGTTDGSCDSLPAGAVVVRHEKPMGCGQAKFSATSIATGDVFLWVDAHQNILSGDVRAMAQRALSNGTIVCPAIGNIYYDDQWKAHRLPESKRLFYPNDDNILPDSTSQYRSVPHPLTFQVGVGLCMSRQSYLRVGGWNRFSGRHGSQERGMALRAFMAGVDVEVDPSTVIGHEFFGATHPSRNPSAGHYRYSAYVPMFNAWHSYMAVCSQAGFANHIRPWLLSYPKGPQGVNAEKDANAIADRDYFQRHCRRRTDSDLFTLMEELLAKKPVQSDPGTAALEPAAVRIIGATARGRCLELGTGSGRGTLALLNGAMSVVSVDHMLRFTTLAKRTITDPRAEFVTCPIDPATGFYDLSTIRGKFDTILIDGPPGTKARVNSIASVFPLLSAGGIILQDDANRDRVSIENGVISANLHKTMMPTKRGLAMLQFIS